MATDKHEVLIFMDRKNCLYKYLYEIKLRSSTEQYIFFLMINTVIFSFPFPFWFFVSTSEFCFL